MNARDPFLWQRDGTDAAGRLGRYDLDALAFFPGMNQPGARKLAWLAGCLDEFERAFEVVPLGRHAGALEAAPHLPLRAPRVNPAPDPFAARFGPAGRSGRRRGGGGWRRLGRPQNYPGWVCCQSKTPISAYRPGTLTEPPWAARHA